MIKESYYYYYYYDYLMPPTTGHNKASAAADHPRDALPHAYRVVHKGGRSVGGRWSNVDCSERVVRDGRQFITLSVHPPLSN